METMTPLTVLAVSSVVQCVALVALLTLVIGLWKRTEARKGPQGPQDVYTVWPAPQGSPGPTTGPLPGDWLRSAGLMQKREPIVDSGEQARIEARKQAEAERAALVLAGIPVDEI